MRKYVSGMFIVIILILMGTLLPTPCLSQNTYMLAISTANSPGKNSGTKSTVTVTWWGPFETRAEGFSKDIPRLYNATSGEEHRWVFGDGDPGFPPEKIKIELKGDDDVWIDWLKIYVKGATWDDPTWFHTWYVHEKLSKRDSHFRSSATLEFPHKTTVTPNQPEYVLSFPQYYETPPAGELVLASQVIVAQGSSEDYKRVTSTDQSFSTSLNVVYKPSVNSRIDFNANYSWKQQVDETIANSVQFMEEGTWTETMKVSRPDDVDGVLVQPVVYAEKVTADVNRGPMISYKKIGPVSATTRYHYVTYGGKRKPNTANDHYATKQAAIDALDSFVKQKTALTKTPGATETDLNKVGTFAIKKGMKTLVSIPPPKGIVITKPMSKQ